MKLKNKNNKKIKSEKKEQINIWIIYQMKLKNKKNKKIKIKFNKEKMIK